MSRSRTRDRLSGADPRCVGARDRERDRCPDGRDAHRRSCACCGPARPIPRRCCVLARTCTSCTPALTRNPRRRGSPRRATGACSSVVPFAGPSLVGTTEVEVASSRAPGELAPSADEIRYLASGKSRVLPGAESAVPARGVRRRARCWTRARRSAAPRASTAMLEEGPLVSVAGGNYTTFRRHGARLTLQPCRACGSGVLRRSCRAWIAAVPRRCAWRPTRSRSARTRSSTVRGASLAGSVLPPQQRTGSRTTAGSASPSKSPGDGAPPSAGAPKSQREQPRRITEALVRAEQSSCSRARPDPLHGGTHA